MFVCICLYLLNHNFTNSNWCVVGKKKCYTPVSIFDCRFFSNHYFSALPPSWMFDALNNLIFFFFGNLLNLIMQQHPSWIIILNPSFLYPLFFSPIMAFGDPNEFLHYHLNTFLTSISFPSCQGKKSQTISSISHLQLHLI